LKINDFPFPRVIARYLVNSHFIWKYYLCSLWPRK
jgi:hypothetical protein